MNSDINFVSNESNILVNTIKNLTVYDSIEKSEISKLFFLDLYFRHNIDFENAVLELDEEYVKNDPIKLKELTKKYNYTFNDKGIFENKKSSSKGISDTASSILRRLGLQCNTVFGHIETVENNKKKYYKHFWNEIKINNSWYCYDYTLNLISYNYKKKEYKEILKFIKMPVTPIDYSLIKRQSNNIKLGGYLIQKNMQPIQDFKYLSDDFSKYSDFDKLKLLKIYSATEKTYNFTKF